jgi:hypothetical protein
MNNISDWDTSDLPGNTLSGKTSTVELYWGTEGENNVPINIGELNYSTLNDINLNVHRIISVDVDNALQKGSDGRLFMPVGANGAKGDIGRAFIYSDFTPEQLESLTGPKGANGAKGDIGKAFTYTDFTPEQLESLTGPIGLKGDKGDKGDTGSRGPIGLTGADSVIPGPIGLTGIKGDTGLKGDKGDTGPKGDNGNNILNQNGNIPLSIWVGTELEYNAVSVKNPTTIYMVT